MDSKLRLFISIMAFYALLAFIAFPLAFYYLVEKSLISAGKGYILGSVVSIALWIFVGQKMIK
jgi:hypothetical protein